MKKWFCRGLLSLALTGIALLAYAQNPLKIGDALPKQFWETPLQMVNTPQKTTTLSADKDKLILLDFWATWCGSCLKNFPKMEALQKKFGEQIKIVAVTKENQVTLQKFFSSKNGQRYKNLQSVMDDRMLTAYFPYVAIPYIVWIKDGKVMNTTDAEQVSEHTIGELINNIQSSLQTVIQINKKRPLLLSELFDGEKGSELQAYSFLSKGRIRGLDYGTYFHRSAQDVVYGRQFTNLSLSEIYQAIAMELYYSQGDRFSPKKIINELQNKTDFDFDTTGESNEVDSKIYSIDFIIPKKEATDLYPRMLKFLNENTPYHAMIEARAVKCLVLKRSSANDKLITRGGEYVKRFFRKPSQLHNVPINELILMLNANSIITNLPVLDETEYTGNVDMDFSDAKDLEIFKKDLAKYDLTLEESVRTIPMLVIKDDQN